MFVYLIVKKVSLGWTEGCMTTDEYTTEEQMLEKVKAPQESRPIRTYKVTLKAKKGYAVCGQCCHTGG